MLFSDPGHSLLQEKYYYSIYDMTIRGSCSCYGHAERCLPERPEDAGITGMVHGKCDCTHNTMGHNCEYCLPDHNDVPWKPATGKKKNECKSKLWSFGPMSICCGFFVLLVTRNS